MAANKVFNFGPVALSTATTTNILNPGAGARATPPVGYTDTQAYIVLRHIRVVNKDIVARNFALWKGLTGANTAGTEVIAAGTATAGVLDTTTGVSVPGNSFFDWYGQMRFDSADFLVGGAKTTLTLVIQGEGEIGVSG
jgi:hypothetical protein